jgi:hypothetical protein
MSPAGVLEPAEETHAEAAAAPLSTSKGAALSSDPSLSRPQDGGHGDGQFWFSALCSDLSSSRQQEGGDESCARLPLRRGELVDEWRRSGEAGNERAGDGVNECSCVAVNEGGRAGDAVNERVRDAGNERSCVAFNEGERVGDGVNEGGRMAFDGGGVGTAGERPARNIPVGLDWYTEGESGKDTAGESDRETDREAGRDTSWESDRDTAGEPANRRLEEPNRDTAGEPKRDTAGEFR